MHPRPTLDLLDAPDEGMADRDLPAAAGLQPFHDLELLDRTERIQINGRQQRDCLVKHLQRALVEPIFEYWSDPATYNSDRGSAVNEHEPVEYARRQAGNVAGRITTTDLALAPRSSSSAMTRPSGSVAA